MEELKSMFYSCLNDEQLGLFHAKRFSDDLEDFLLDNLTPIQYGHYKSWMEAEDNQNEPSISAPTITDSGVSTFDDAIGEIRSLKEEMKLFQSTLLTTIMKKMNEMEKRLAKSIEPAKMMYDQGSQTDCVTNYDGKVVAETIKPRAVLRETVERVSVNNAKPQTPESLVVKTVATPTNASSKKIVQMQSAIEQSLMKLQAEVGEKKSTIDRIQYREQIPTPSPVVFIKPVAKRRLGIEFPTFLSEALLEEMKTITVSSTMDLTVDQAMRYQYSILHLRSTNTEEILNLAHQIWNFLKSHMTEKETLDDSPLISMFDSWSRWERILFQINCSTAIAYHPVNKEWSLYSWDKSLIEASVGRATTLRITSKLPSNIFNFPL